MHKLAPLVAIPALTLTLVSVLLPALLGAVVVACLVAHVVGSLRTSADASRLASFGDDLDAMPLSTFAADVERAIDAATSARFYKLQATRTPRATVRPSVRPFRPVALRVSTLDVDSSAPALPIRENVSTNAAPSTVRAEKSALPSVVASPVPHLVRLAFDCQQSARDAAIKVRVACIVGDADTAEKWANLACALTWQAREYRDASGNDRNAVAYVRGCVEALSIACDAIDKRWPISAPRVTSALVCAAVPRIAPLPRVARDVASPARVVTVTRLLPPAPTLRALPLKASRAKRASRTRANA